MITAAVMFTSTASIWDYPLWDLSMILFIYFYLFVWKSFRYSCGTIHSSRKWDRSVKAPSRSRINQAEREGDRSHNSISVFDFLIGLFATRLKLIHYATVRVLCHMKKIKWINQTISLSSLTFPLVTNFFGHAWVFG